MSRNKHLLKYTGVGRSGLIQCCCFWTFKSLWLAVTYFFKEEFTVFWKFYTHILNLSVVVFLTPINCSAAVQHQLIQLISCYPLLQLICRMTSFAWPKQSVGVFASIVIVRFAVRTKTFILNVCPWCTLCFWDLFIQTDSAYFKAGVCFPTRA